MRFLLCIIFSSFSMLFAQEIEENIFGFATSNTFTYCDVEDTSFINQVIALNPKVLRFPGGAVGNFYHFGKNGYGFDFKEIDRYHNGKFPKRSRGLEKSRKKLNHNYDYIYSFIKLAKATNAKAVLVANPFVAKDDDIILMIKELYKNNIEIIGVELGSELSNRSYFLKGYTIDDYLVFAQRCSKRIKTEFPELKTAIVAAPLGKRKGHRHNVWNNRLAEMDFYDAIIIHSYTQVIQGKTLAGQMVHEEIEGENNKEKFDLYKSRALNYLHFEYADEVQQYIAIYNKPIWVTEWNLQMSKTTGNTLFQSLFVSQYTLEVLSNPFFSSIELATYHNLGGRDFSGSIFRNNKSNMEIQSTYLPMTLVGKIFEDSVTNIISTRIKNVFNYKCYDKYGKELLIYRLDWDSNRFTCIYNILDSSADSIVYKSANLFDTADKNGILDLQIYND